LEIGVAGDPRAGVFDGERGVGGIGNEFSGSLTCPTKLDDELPVTDSGLEPLADDAAFQGQWRAVSQMSAPLEES